MANTLTTLYEVRQYALSPTTTRDLEREKLGKIQAFLRTMQMEASTRYTDAQIRYVQSVIALRSSLMALDEQRFERDLQLKRFERFNDFVQMQTNKILAQLQASDTALKDAVALEERRLFDRETEKLEAQKRRNDALAALARSDQPAEPTEEDWTRKFATAKAKKTYYDFIHGVSDDPPAPEPPKQEKSQQDEEFEAEAERLQTLSRKTSEFNSRWEKYAREHGGWANLSKEEQARYESEKAALEKILKAHYRA